MKEYLLHIVPHTHWDREWYFSFQKFRKRLVRLIDLVLEILEKDPEFKSFLLDGQTVVLEDYLEIKPKKKERIKRLVKEGRLQIGPWYVLADEFLVSGEALIRNLLLGFQIGEEFGGVMKVGYLPDQFGHISQMPQILQGFGIDTAVLSRGVIPNPFRIKTQSLWEAPDGSWVLLEYLPYGYCNAWTLSFESEEKCIQEIKEIKKRLSPFLLSRHLLLMNGCDHLFPRKNLSSLLKKVNSSLTDCRLIHSTFPQYFASLKKELNFSTLKKRKGELREPGNLLYGVLSTRMWIKQRNSELQDLLEKWAEPLSAVRWVEGEEYPEGFIWEAWKNLLKNHPHDSICGCSIDLVHQDMLSRFDQAKFLGEELTLEGLEFLAGRIKAPSSGKWLLVFNPLGWEQSEVVRGKITFPREEKVKNIILLDPEGKEAPLRVVRKKRERLHIEEVISFEIEFLARNVPPFGWLTYRVCPGKRVYSPSLRIGPDWMENSFLRVKVNENGSFDLEDKKSGLSWRGLGLFEDGADGGDEYNYSPLPQDEIITTRNSRACISPGEIGPDWGELEVSLKISLPESLTRDRKRRRKRKVSLPIFTRIRLYSHSRRVDIVTEVENRARDHRLRVFFPSGAEEALTSLAESKFEVVERPILPSQPEEDVGEEPPSTHPQESFVLVRGKRKGLAVFNRGLPEYEVKNDKERTICLTLFRSVGWLSRDDLLTRRGNAGPSLPTPGAQCLFKQTFHYSLLPLNPSLGEEEIWREAYSHRIGLRTKFFSTSSPGNFPLQGSLMEISPPNFVLSAVKKAEGKDLLVVRLFNTLPQEKEGLIRFYWRVKEAFQLNLREDILSPLPVEKGRKIKIKPKGKEIYTLGVKFFSD